MPRIEPAIILELKELRAEINYSIKCRRFQKDFEHTYATKLTPGSSHANSVNMTVSFNKQFELWYHPDIFNWTIGYQCLKKNCQEFKHLWETDSIIWKLSTEHKTFHTEWVCPLELHYDYMKRFGAQRVRA